MKVWRDLLSGDEMVSDAYPHEIVMGGAALKVQSRFVTKGAEDFGISNNDEEGDGGLNDAGGETVVDVADGMRLKEITLDKKSWLTYIKGYLGKVVEKMKENGNEARLPEFKKGSTELTKYIMSKFDEFQIFTGETNDYEGAYGYAIQEDETGEQGPVFYFFVDGFQEVKL